MPDTAIPYLTDNCEPCPACELQREAMDMGAIERPLTQCQVCGGEGYLKLGGVEIVRRTVAWAREYYWPQAERRWAGKR